MHWKPAFKKRKITLNLPIVSFASLAIEFMNIRPRALPLIGIICFPLIFTVIRKLIKKCQYLKCPFLCHEYNVYPQKG